MKDEHRAPAERRGSRWRLLGNVLAGMIGVQSDDTHRQNLAQGGLETYVLKVVVGLVVFVLVVALIAL